ncbi:ClbS/DfsB family four-helix bundle protein [Neisseriaceae bacterium ESL0693]|nr:ClbS/DfsB family four-helix bundle protein [Neisseriaceae bacterium ESL0693]
MKSYQTKAELLAMIRHKYAKYIAEFDDIPDHLKDVRIEAVDKTPAENLSYQIGWVNLLLSWERKEKNGEKVHTPAKGYKWNNLGGLYQQFYQQYAGFTLNEQVRLLNHAVDELCLWVDSLIDQELFEPDQRAWATTQARWPVWKWIHINTVAPFTHFRTKIRRWKEYVLQPD